MCNKKKMFRGCIGGLLVSTIIRSGHGINAGALQGGKGSEQNATSGDLGQSNGLAPDLCESKSVNPP